MNIATLEYWAGTSFTVSDLAKGILETYYNATFIHNPNQINGNENRIAKTNDIQIGTKLYPNPASEFVTIVTELMIGDRLTVFSSTGHEMKTMNLLENTSAYSINIADFASGIYLIQIQKHSGELENMKFVVFLR